MSWNHGTYGWEAFEDFCRSLKRSGIHYAISKKRQSFVRGQDLQHYCKCANSVPGCPCCRGTCGHFQQLRMAHFSRGPVRLIAEEFLTIDDTDWNGRSQIGFVIYPVGKRPKLRPLVLSPLGVQTSAT